MVVDEHGCEGGGIHAVFPVLGNLGCEHRVECVNTFHHEYLVVLKSQFLSALLALARLEVISWQLHFLSSQ